MLIQKNKCSIIESRNFTGVFDDLRWEVLLYGIQRKNDSFMTNDEYREELNKIFENINENYKLKWFYKFIIKKLEGNI